MSTTNDDMHDFSVNDRVNAEHRSEWRPGKIKSVKANNVNGNMIYFVQFDGMKWFYNEWLSPHQLRPLSFPATASIAEQTEQPAQMEMERIEREKKEQLKALVRGWWIGQRIESVTQSEERITGRIADYCAETGEVQIWYDNAENTFERVKLVHLQWTVASCHRIDQYGAKGGYVPKLLEYHPTHYPMLSRVRVRYVDGNWYTAFVDGYDSVSRRYHINYGDTTEWLWSSKKSMRALKNGDRLLEHVEQLRSGIERTAKFATPLPWDPKPYGLDSCFARYSAKVAAKRAAMYDPDGNETVTSCSSVSLSEDAKKRSTRKRKATTKRTRKQKGASMERAANSNASVSGGVRLRNGEDLTSSASTVDTVLAPIAMASAKKRRKIDIPNAKEKRRIGFFNREKDRQEI